jgi:hypothetical protein
MGRFAALLVSLAVAAPAAAALIASRHQEPLPAELAPAIAPAFSTAADGPSAGVRVAAGGVTLDFWWVKALAIAGTAESPWGGVAEGTLVGAVRIGADFRDIRGRVIKAGVYTLRYGLQPANGDHLGVSPFRDFLLLSPAAADRDPAPRGHDGTIEISKLAIGGSHPGVWSIDPPVASSQPPLAVQKTELDHDAVVVEVATVRDGRPAGALKFGLVLIGKIEA